jgi:hypothetical protein
MEDNIVSTLEACEILTQQIEHILAELNLHCEEAAKFGMYVQISKTEKIVDNKNIPSFILNQASYNVVFAKT